jgi:hypothetical protein
MGEPEVGRPCRVSVVVVVVQPLAHRSERMTTAHAWISGLVHLGCCCPRLDVGVAIATLSGTAWVGGVAPVAHRSGVSRARVNVGSDGSGSAHRHDVHLLAVNAVEASAVDAADGALLVLMLKPALDASDDIFNRLERIHAANLSASGWYQAGLLCLMLCDSQCLQLRGDVVSAQQPQPQQPQPYPYQPQPQRSVAGTTAKVLLTIVGIGIGLVLLLIVGVIVLYQLT